MADDKEKSKEFKRQSSTPYDDEFHTPDVMTMRFLTLGGEVKYKIPIIKMQKYTLRDIWEKEMYLLFPFYIFTHEANVMFSVFKGEEDVSGE